MKGDISADLHERKMRHGKTALLIDGDADRRNYLKTILQSKGFEVRIHGQVFEKHRDSSGHFALISFCSPQI